MGKAHATTYTDEAKGRLKTGGAILPKPPPSFPRRRESRCRSDTCIRQKHLTRLSFPKNRYWKCRIRESDLRQKTVAGEEKPVAWALPTNQTQNFRRPLLVIIVGEAPRYNVHRQGKRPSENRRSNFCRNLRRHSRAGGNPEV